MDRLTPELWLYSAFEGVSNGLETRELDFNLARRSGVIINHIDSQLHVYPDVTSGFEVLGTAIQEVDLDPDNVDVEFAGAMRPDAVVMDSSRVLRHIQAFGWDTAGGVGHTDLEPRMSLDWKDASWTERPISITNIRHHISVAGGISLTYHGEIRIAYFLVELSLAEIGILTASRR